jgi:hypothetical protein
MSSKRTKKPKQEPRERSEQSGSADRGKPQRELSRPELEQLRERLQKKFH